MQRFIIQPNNPQLHRSLLRVFRSHLIQKSFFICPGNQQMFRCVMTQKERTVKTAWAMAQSLSQGLSQQNSLQDISQTHTHTHKYTPSKLSAGPCTHALISSPGMRMREFELCVWLPGLWGLVEHWLSKWDSSDRLIQLHNTHSHTHNSLLLRVCNWGIVLFQGFIEHSVFIHPKSTHCHCSTLKNVEAPRGEERILVHYTRNALTDGIKLSD